MTKKQLMLSTSNLCYGMTREQLRDAYLNAVARDRHSSETDEQVHGMADCIMRGFILYDPLTDQMWENSEMTSEIDKFLAEDD